MKEESTGDRVVCVTETEPPSATSGITAVGAFPREVESELSVTLCQFTVEPPLNADERDFTRTVFVE
jgi:hypothetical protein